MPTARTEIRCLPFSVGQEPPFLWNTRIHLVLQEPIEWTLYRIRRRVRNVVWRSKRWGWLLRRDIRSTAHRRVHVLRLACDARFCPEPPTRSAFLQRCGPQPQVVWKRAGHRRRNQLEHHYAGHAVPR